MLFTLLFIPTAFICAAALGGALGLALGTKVKIVQIELPELEGPKFWSTCGRMKTMKANIGNILSSAKHCVTFLWFALLIACESTPQPSPTIEVKAITVTGAGETHCAPGVRNVLGLIALAGEKAIPVACGRETPLGGNQTFPAAWREGADGMMGLVLPASSEQPSAQSAVALLTSVVQSSPQKITLLTLSPLTNLAEALAATPSLKSKLEMIYVMGGALNVPGNVGASGVEIDNAVAEWNIYVDPHAANMVLKSGAPITLVPLDATNRVPVTAQFYERLLSQHTSPEATFVYDLLTRNRGFIESGNYFFWDPLAAAILIDESLATLETRKLMVIEDEGPQSGQTRTSDDGAAVRVAVSADGARFERQFLDALNAP